MLNDLSLCFNITTLNANEQMLTVPSGVMNIYSLLFLGLTEVSAVCDNPESLMILCLQLNLFLLRKPKIMRMKDVKQIGQDLQR